MRASATLFGLVCVAGSACALGLTVQEARYVPPLDAQVVSTSRVGQRTTVVAEVRNTTAVGRCAQLYVAARDREGRDLAVGTAGAARLVGPRERRRETIGLTLSARQYAEQLQRFAAYTMPC